MSPCPASQLINAWLSENSTPGLPDTKCTLVGPAPAKVAQSSGESEPPGAQIPNKKNPLHPQRAKGQALRFSSKPHNTPKTLRLRKVISRGPQQHGGKWSPWSSKSGSLVSWAQAQPPSRTFHTAPPCSCLPANSKDILWLLPRGLAQPMHSSPSQTCPSLRELKDSFSPLHWLLLFKHTLH